MRRAWHTGLRPHLSPIPEVSSTCDTGPPTEELQGVGRGRAHKNQADRPHAAVGGARGHEQTLRGRFWEEATPQRNLQGEGISQAKWPGQSKWSDGGDSDSGEYRGPTVCRVHLTCQLTETSRRTPVSGKGNRMWKAHRGQRPW